MSKDDFYTLYFGDFSPSDESIKLDELALEYHRRVEAFDKAICKWHHGTNCYMPFTESQSIQCSKNARDVLNDILARNPDVIRKDLSKAISNMNYKETPP